jgi:hypothetical protein
MVEAHGSWHLTDIPTGASDVRCWRQTGHRADNPAGLLLTLAVWSGTLPALK